MSARIKTGSLVLAAACGFIVAASVFVWRGAVRAAQAPLTAASLANSQTQPRNFFGRKLEPRDVVLHGAGQSDTVSFIAYSTAVEPDSPMLFMTYIDLKGDLPGYFARLRTQLDSLPQFAVPQIGLSLNSDDPHHHYEADVASGALDPALQYMCEGLFSLNRPVFLRPGYEFNGAWNGYEARAYVAAFRHIVEKTRVCGLKNVAFVWDWSADSDASKHVANSWAAYYPGDAWVDWWGINLFSPASLTSAATQAFLADAEAHRFPVMIAESSAKQQPVATGQRAIDDWFAPYFGLIRRSPGIKAFCYIDWDWGRFPQWANWGDERIESNATVLSFYRKQLHTPLFADARDKNATLKLLQVK